MRLWPGEFNVHSSDYLYSLATVLLILCLAECAYWYLTSTHKDKHVTSTHLITCYENFVEFTSFVRSSLTNVRCPGSSGGCGLGEVRQLVIFDPLLTHFPSLSSRWILSIVATAWVGSTITCVVLFALSLPRHSYCMLSQFTSGSLKIDLVKSGLYVFMIRRLMI